MTVYLSPRLAMVHISACNRKGFEEVVAEVGEVIVTRAPSGYYMVVGKYINGRKVAFTHIKRVFCQTNRVVDGEPKFEWRSQTPFRVRAGVGSFELEVTRGSE